MNPNYFMIGLVIALTIGMIFLVIRSVWLVFTSKDQLVRNQMALAWNTFFVIVVALAGLYALGYGADYVLGLRL